MRASGIVKRCPRKRRKNGLLPTCIRPTRQRGQTSATGSCSLSMRMSLRFRVKTFVVLMENKADAVDRPITENHTPYNMVKRNRAKGARIFAVVAIIAHHEILVF